MKRISGIIAIAVCAVLNSAAQPGNSSQPAAGADLDATLSQIRQTTQAAGTDISRLQIARWKGDSAQKVQMQQVADSLKKNLTFAVPDLITAVESSRGSLSSTFRLYHNLNVVYEFLNSLAEAAGAYGRREEYEPLAGDASALDGARQKLSSYIEKEAARLEKPPPTPTPAATPPPRKIIVDEEAPTKKSTTTRKKKTSSPKPSPSPSPQ